MEREREGGRARAVSVHRTVTHTMSILCRKVANSVMPNQPVHSKTNEQMNESECLFLSVFLFFCGQSPRIEIK